MSASAQAVATEQDPVASRRNAPGRRPFVAATISTADGRLVTGGIASIEGASEGAWTAVVGQLDRPGIVASLYFGEHVRDVMLRLEDGRRGRARIAGTSFTAGRQRICELIGVAPLT